MEYLRLVSNDSQLVDPKLDSPAVFLSEESGKVVIFGLEQEPVGPSSREIWYTSSDGDIVEAMMSPVSNVYQDGKGVMTFADDVTSISEDAFFCRESLTSITIPDAVTSIGKYAFYGCTSLTSITIPDAVTSIGANAFEDCSSLTSITIPSLITSISNKAFFGCASLTNIVIPSLVTSIGINAFYNCSGLTSVTIGKSVTNIGMAAFESCSSLSNISFNGTISQWNAITKPESWYNVPATVVHCSDGDVTL